MSARWIDQTRTRDTHPAVRGDCTRAAIASLFALPLDAVPDFDADDPVAFYEGVEAFFLSLGYEMVRLDGDVALDALHLANGPAARGVSHSVVRRGTEIVHDPHPSRAGLLSVEFVVVPVPLDPSRLLPAQAYRERLQAIVDWADLAHSASHEFADHGLGLLRGPVFDEARAALSTLPAAAGGDPTPAVGGAALPGVEEIAEAFSRCELTMWECDGFHKPRVVAVFDSEVEAQRALNSLEAHIARLADHQARPAAQEGVDGRKLKDQAQKAVDAWLEHEYGSDYLMDAMEELNAALASSAPAGGVDGVLVDADDLQWSVPQSGTINLLPCPFCGSSHIDPTGWASKDAGGPACDNCSATALTAEAWNTRAVALDAADGGAGAGATHAAERVASLVADLWGECSISGGKFDASQWKIDTPVLDLMALVRAVSPSALSSYTPPTTSTTTGTEGRDHG